MPINLCLLEALTITTIKHRRSFSDHRLLAEWLDCYQYVMPADRKLDDELAADIYLYATNTPHRLRARDVFHGWLLAELVETTCTLQNQRNILSWLSTHEYSY